MIFCNGVRCWVFILFCENISLIFGIFCGINIFIYGIFILVCGINNFIYGIIILVCGIIFSVCGNKYFRLWDYCFGLWNLIISVCGIIILVCGMFFFFFVYGI